MTKTIRNHLLYLKPEHKYAALTNMNPEGMTRKASSMANALHQSFDWKGSPEGHSYWARVFSQLASGKYHFTAAESAGRAVGLPEDSEQRKEYPIYGGLITYFGDALAAVSKLSYEGNQQHHPDEPLHWDESKSTDSRDALMRHIFDMETANKNLDSGKELDEATRVAWRGLENLQRLINGTCQYTKNK